MKTQISKPVRERTSYTKEYKEEALELWCASGRSAAKIAAQLGVRPPLLYRWTRTERVLKIFGGESSLGLKIHFSAHAQSSLRPWLWLVGSAIFVVAGEQIAPRFKFQVRIALTTLAAGLFLFAVWLAYFVRG